MVIRQSIELFCAHGHLSRRAARSIQSLQNDKHRLCCQRCGAVTWLGRIFHWRSPKRCSPYRPNIARKDSERTPEVAVFANVELMFG